MSLKMKIISLVLLALLVLPVVMTPQQRGSVLGVIESNTGQLPISENRIGEIGSGALDVRTTDLSSNSDKVFSGKAEWDENTRSQVTSDKFPLGRTVKVTAGDKTLNLVVGDVRVLPTDTLLVLNQKTFEQLGGDPKTQKNIEVTVSLD